MEPAHVLIVEPDASFALSLASLFQGDGCATSVARTAEEARLRAGLAETARERDQLARELAEVSRERDALVEARRALEKVHEALAQARTRMG